MLQNIIVPRLSRKRGHKNWFVRLSVFHKNFNLAHIFWSINDRALIFGINDFCDTPFLLIPCSDFDLDLWPTSRSYLLLGGGPQFFEFACYSCHFLLQILEESKLDEAAARDGINIGATKSGVDKPPQEEVRLGGV